ncbi:MAG: methyltransferase domain-containing protein [Gammaproteobacteria bacterium]|nr:methyltransferase domain-containing protein [Rhizobiaceae bacterium]NKC13748.1 methyltransferase domain-containing protein [Gammaproteobacteria bacterium]
MNSTSAGLPANNDAATERARRHYNSQDAENLYEFVIGSDTLNLGLYDEPPTRTIAQAMQKTTEWMAGNAVGLNADFHVLDIGAGYGPAARYLARTYGCHVICLNISEEQNAKNEALNREQGLDHLITIVPGNFKQMPLPDASFDLAWTQDALFHTDELDKVLAETYRVLKPGGQFLLMDILQADNCPDGALATALSRVNIHHQRIGSFQYYREIAAGLGFECLNTVELSKHLLIHYSNWRDAVIEHYAELSRICSTDFLELTQTGFAHWVEAAENGLFEWGLLHFRRP